jgi:uncharacterized oxidoreductase
MVRLDPKKLRDLVTGVFLEVGSKREEAELISLHLVDSNLAGHESHGVVRVPRYVEYVRNGQVRPNQTGKVVHDTGTMLLIDGGAGFGQSVGQQAVMLGIGRALDQGLALVGLRNTGHLGRIGGWAELAAKAGLVSIHFVNSPGRGGIQVAPGGGRERRLAPNPIAIGIPQASAPPFLLDITSAVIPEGKVLVALNRSESLPEGVAIDAEGQPTRDPKSYYGPPPGALLPIGGHKGFGLCMAIDLLAGALTRGGCSDPRQTLFGNNMMSVYINPGAIGSSAYLADAVRDLSYWVRSAAPIELGDEVLAPGDMEARCRAARLEKGVPLDPTTWRLVRETALSVGVAAKCIDAVL